MKMRTPLAVMLALALTACAGGGDGGGDGADTPIFEVVQSDGHASTDAVLTPDVWEASDAAQASDGGDGSASDGTSVSLDVGQDGSAFDSAAGETTSTDVAEVDAAEAVPCGDGVCGPDEGCATCPEDCPACAPGPGEVVITEIMQDPAAVGDAVGEWLEIHNPGDAPIDLAGLSLSDDGEDAHLISPGAAGTLIIAPGGYVVLGATADLGVGWTVDYVWADFALGNGADEVILAHEETVIDAVAYDGGDTFPDITGASMSLDPAATAADGNDDGAHWCAGVDVYGAGDLGTPGGANPPCPVPCGDGTCGEDEDCSACPEDCGVCPFCGDGDCAGEETCGTCEADCGVCCVPTDEVCNGIDDDCDGDTDEAPCSDGLPCTDDVCLGAQGCASSVSPGMCLIDGICRADGTTSPSDGCLACLSGVSQSVWSPATGTQCSDGDGCTEDDICILGECV
ncbi:MAG: lamin tail domain-containing protein, partial [Myxococcota bacterium]|nr:lamin tail domain-containing protein [Myxococcota bacterium]